MWSGGLVRGVRVLLVLLGVVLLGVIIWNVTVSILFHAR